MNETTHEQGGLKIKDSGTRRDFGTGSVRDAAAGKGRMDLMPMNLLVALTNLANAGIIHDDFVKLYPGGVVTPRRVALYHLFQFMRGDGSVELFQSSLLLLEALGRRADEPGAPLVTQVSIPNWRGVLEVSKLYEAGCLKYGDRNWEKGQPIHVYVDSAMRHLVKDIAGHTDEDHLVAACWNVLCAIETLEWVSQRELPETLLNGLPARVREPLVESIDSVRKSIEKREPVGEEKEAAPPLPTKGPDGKYSWAP
jgi:hypothetical protein